MPIDFNKGESYEIIWKKVTKLSGAGNRVSLGVERCLVSIDKLPNIMELGFSSLDHKFNDSPTVAVFYEFGKRAAKYGATVHFEAFLESQYREDSRLVIEGIRVTNFPESAKLIMDFAQTFHSADEFTAKPELLRAWFD